MAKVANLDDRRKQKENAKPDLSGHNAVMTKSLFRSHVATLKELKDKETQAKANYAAGRKAAKADGINLKDLDEVMKYMNLTDEEIVAKMNTRIEYMGFMDMPIAEQMELFDITFDPEPKSEEELIAKAREEGEIAARSGKGAFQSDNPYEAGSPQGQAWLEGWHEGTRQTASEMKPEEEGVLEDPPSEETVDA